MSIGGKEEGALHAMNNGTMSALESDAIQSEMEIKHSNLQRNHQVMIPSVSGCS